jgi:hypothetical protein
VKVEIGKRESQGYMTKQEETARENVHVPLANYCFKLHRFSHGLAIKTSDKHVTQRSYQQAGVLVDPLKLVPCEASKECHPLLMIGASYPCHQHFLF